MFARAAAGGYTPRCAGTPGRALLGACASPPSMVPGNVPRPFAASIAAPRGQPTRRAAQDEEAGASEDDEADEHAGGAALGAAELAGMRVRHSAEELGAGETLVMTLADRPVLDARGELADDADELENPLAVPPAAMPLDQG